MFDSFEKLVLDLVCAPNEIAGRTQPGEPTHDHVGMDGRGQKDVVGAIFRIGGNRGPKALFCLVHPAFGLGQHDLGLVHPHRERSIFVGRPCLGRMRLHFSHLIDKRGRQIGHKGATGLRAKLVAGQSKPSGQKQGLLVQSADRKNDIGPAGS